jgi:hypothetical protein
MAAPTRNDERLDVISTADAPPTVKRGDTTLRNIRVEDDLWRAAGDACAALKREHGIVTDRSKIARDAYQTVIEQQHDPQWLALVQLAKERDTTPEELQKFAVAQYVASIQRKRAKRAK